MSLCSIPVETLTTVARFLSIRSLLCLRICNRMCLCAFEIVGKTPDECRTNISRESIFLFNSLEQIVLRELSEEILDKLNSDALGLVELYSEFEKENNTANGGRPLSSLRIRERFNAAWYAFTPGSDNALNLFEFAEFFVEYEFDELDSDDEEYDIIDEDEYRWAKKIISTYGVSARSSAIAHAFPGHTIPEIKREARELIGDYAKQVDKELSSVISSNSI